LIKKLTIVFIAVIILISASISEAGTRIETKTAPNYLVILVHGINTAGFVFKGNGENGSKVAEPDGTGGIPDSMRGFGDLLGYLNNNLGLEGYVYYYTFSQRDGRVETLARELGDRNYHASPAYRESIMNHKGLTDQPDIDKNKEPKLFSHLGYPSPIQQVSGESNCWLEQARQDFKKWYADKYYKGDISKVSESVIPKKYILICHSMGGLVARQYLSSDYYQNDVESIITIDSQHLGSDGAQALKKMAEFYDSADQITGSFAEMMGLTWICLANNWDDGARYCSFSGIMLLMGRGLVDNFTTKGSLGWYPSQPGVQDMDSEGSFIAALNSKAFVKGNQPIKARFIS